MARLLLLDVFDNEVKEVECDELDDYYKFLRCGCFDIAHRQIGGKYFDIFVDDIGLYAEQPIVSAINSKHEPMLVGNLIFANHDSEGNTTDLTNGDIAIIRMNIMDNIAQYNNKHELIHAGKMLVGCDY